MNKWFVIFNIGAIKGLKRLTFSTWNINIKKKIQNKNLKLLAEFTQLLVDKIFIFQKTYAFFRIWKLRDKNHFWNLKNITHFDTSYHIENYSWYNNFAKTLCLDKTQIFVYNLYISLSLPFNFKTDFLNILYSFDNIF